METLYVLIKTESGKLIEVFKEVEKKPCVSEIWAVSGEYDILVKLNIALVAEAADIIINKIRKIKGVKATTTLVTIKI